MAASLIFAGGGDGTGWIALRLSSPGVRGMGGLRYAVLLDSALLHLAHGLSPYEKK